MVAQVVLRLSGPMDHLRLVWQTGESLLESVVFDEDPEFTRYNVLLAVQEMVTNVLRHAYGMDQTQQLEVEFTVAQDIIEVAIRDHGPAFNPLEHDTTELDVEDSLPPEGGGYGIYVAKVVMDEVCYERLKGCNVLRLRKLVGKSAEVFRT